ncbi:hypothetical protein H0W26_04010 [Candidatus Dependentiae bacterium]|nr:hypothetical protein [Candidatus Dependentiae bacterium]
MHAVHRMRERYGLNLDDATQETIHRRIQSGRARAVKAQEDDAGTFVIEIAGQDVGVLYSVANLKIITILPPTDLRVSR